MHVHVLLEDPADEELSATGETFISALRGLDMMVSRLDIHHISTERCGAVVVILDSKRKDRNNNLERTLASEMSSLIPVASGSDPSSTFPDLSQILLGRTGPDTAAKRVALIARYGGTNLAWLFRLEALASQWSGKGKPPNLLPRGAAIERGLTTIASASYLASADAAAFVSAGLAKRRRRTRRIVTAVVVVALVLVATSAIALVQRASATRATDRADQNAAHSDSIRLAQLAVDTLSSDPDLPWIYAERALAREASPEAQNAAQRVLTASPTHVSVRLPKLANEISGDPKSNTVLIHYEDGSIELRSGVDGKSLHQFPVTATSSSLAPGGKIVQADGAFIDATTGETIWRLPARETFRAWGGPTRALVNVGGNLAVVGLTDKTITRTTIEVSSSGRSAWSLAAQAPILAFIDQDKLQVINLSTGKSLSAVSVSAASDVAISAEGAAVYVASQSKPKMFTVVDGALKENAATVVGTAVVATGKNWVVSSPDGGISWVSQSQSVAAYHYAAHRGPTVGTVEVGAGKTASVGGDAFLRLWSAPPEQIIYPIPNLELRSFDQFNLEQPWLRATGRSLLARSDREDRISSVIQSLNLFGSYDGDLKSIGPIRQLPQVSWSVRPLPDGRLAYITHFGGGVMDTARGKKVWEHTTPIPQAVALIAANDSGTRIAYASVNGLDSFGATGDTTQTKFDGQRVPVAVSIDQSGHASAVTSDGWWYRESLPAVHFPGVAALVAAAVDTDGRVLLVGSDGAVLEYRDGKTIQLAELGATLDPFAVRVSTDSHLIAVLGSAHTVVLRRADGTQVADLYPTGGSGTEVRDVALSPEHVWEIRADGGIVSRRIQPSDQANTFVANHQPRPVTPIEIEVIAGSADSVGER